MNRTLENRSGILSLIINKIIWVIGPQSAGKTMLSKRLPTTIPSLALETNKIHAVACKIGKDISLMTIAPFWSPHPTISDIVMFYYLVNLIDYLPY